MNPDRMLHLLHCCFLLLLSVPSTALHIKLLHRASAATPKSTRSASKKLQLTRTTAWRTTYGAKPTSCFIHSSVKPTVAAWLTCIISPLPAMAFAETEPFWQRLALKIAGDLPMMVTGLSILGILIIVEDFRSELKSALANLESALEDLESGVKGALEDLESALADLESGVKDTVNNPDLQSAGENKTNEE